MKQKEIYSSNRDFGELEKPSKRGKSCTDRKYYHSTWYWDYDTVLNDTYANISPEYDLIKICSHREGGVGRAIEGSS